MSKRLRQLKEIFLEAGLAGSSQKAENLARTLILSEKGYSSSGIAGQIGVTESTAKNYLDQIESEFGKSAVFALRPEKKNPNPDLRRSEN